MTIVRGQPEAVVGTPTPRVVESIQTNLEYLFSDLASLETALAIVLSATPNSILTTDADGNLAWVSTLPSATLPSNVLTE